MPSSSFTLAAKSQGSIQSSSRNTSRPPSSATQRPPSSLSTRPVSSASTRPQSRFSNRPHSRHARSRLIPICQTLVSQITGIHALRLGDDAGDDDAEGDEFRELVEYAVKNLESSTINKAAASVDLSVIDRQMSGLALKARINSRDVLGEALESAYKKLKLHIEQQETDLDHDIKASRIPDHLQLLLALGRPPSEGTVEIAKTYLDAIANPPPAPPILTWADILAEEPFEGEHWECVFGLPPGNVRSATRENRDKDEWDSTPSLSPLNSDDLALDEDEDDSFSSTDYGEPLSPKPIPSPSVELSTSNHAHAPYTYDHRKQFEELRSKQYWRNDWHTDAPLFPRFDIGDPSSLGPALASVLAQESGHRDAQAMLQSERYIDEDDMVREILMAIQGNKNIILTWNGGSFKISPSTPRLIHLSMASQESIITSLAKTATTVEQLRRFVTVFFSRSILHTNADAYRKIASTRTCEAFADAIDETMRGLDAWCAAREEAMCRAYAGVDEEPLVVSLLGTEKALQDQYGTSFEILLEIVWQAFQIKPGEDMALLDKSATLPQKRLQPSALTALLLDTLFTSVQQHMERRDTVTSDALMRVFVRTAEPVWGMVGSWLKNGMGLGLGIGSGGESGMPGRTKELDDEFFIESSGVGVGMMGMGLLDPEFWKEGYSLREGVVSYGEDASTLVPTRKTIPSFLDHIAELVLGTGKAVGLMRALGEPPLSNTFGNWRSFSEIVRSETHNVDGRTEEHAGLFSVSVDTLSQLIYDSLLPHCQATGARLAKVLVDECGLWKHLNAIEDLFLMRKGDTMSHFIDVLFNKMDSNQPWGDFHFLNTAFNDVLEANNNAGGKEWLNASLVRFSYRGSRDKDRSIKRTVKAIDPFFLEYAVPFPLTYIFQPKTIHAYSEVFVFLLQIRRAKNVLERILVRDERGRGKELREELKVFYAMRSRLSWFINTLLNFLTTYVIHPEVSRFHEAFRRANSLDEMIQLHEEHLEKIRGRCLLKPNTSALHRAILSVLDMCLHFSEGFVAFAGDITATLDVSRQSIIMKRHRSRKQRRQRKNVIGFSQSLQSQDDSSDDEEDDEQDAEGADHGHTPLEPSYSFGASVTSEENFFVLVERMSSELDGLVRFLRRGTESLAGGASEAAPAFGVLAFALEDWDI